MTKKKLISLAFIAFLLLSSVPSLFGNCTYPGQYFSHEDACNLYYECSEDLQMLTYACPDGLVYNSELEICDFPSNVNCDGRMKYCGGCFIMVGLFLSRTINYFCDAPYAHDQMYAFGFKVGDPVQIDKTTGQNICSNAG